MLTADGVGGGGVALSPHQPPDAYTQEVLIERVVLILVSSVDCTL